MPNSLPYILLIDDDEDDMELLSSSLELAGLSIKILNAGDKVMNYLNLKIGPLPALIILDYNMPRINGEQVLLLLKSNTYTKDIPVIMYSTTMSPVFKNAIIDMGALACFIKPSTYSEFTTQVALFRDITYSTIPARL
jgi:DNA-binding response OmpR family regulator